MKLLDVQRVVGEMLEMTDWEKGMNIPGIPGMSDLCPISNYVHNILDILDVTHREVLTGDGEVHVYSPNLNLLFSLALPQAANNFVRKFDRGETSPYYQPLTGINLS